LPGAGRGERLKNEAVGLGLSFAVMGIYHRAHRFLLLPYFYQKEIGLMNKIDIKNLSKAELEEAVAGLGAQKYRARQVFKWLHKAAVKSFDEMSDISADLRRRLKDKFHISKFILLDSRRSFLDGTTKYLFKLEDGKTIETVLIPEPMRGTICLSSQVGCRYACDFCASAALGFSRNLNSSEIIDEVLSVRGLNPSSPVTNLVFMGIGEPLDNYDNVLRAIRVINDKDGLNIGSRKITISTCGIVPGIERLMEEALQIELSVSLHSADDTIRSRLVPVNKRYPLKVLLERCRDYIRKTNRLITFEYVLIKDLNSSREDALKLAKLLKNMKCKVNTISYNRIRAKDYMEPDEKNVKIFIKTLKDRGILAIHRRSRGDDIDAGCGQLRISRQ